MLVLIVSDFHLGKGRFLKNGQPNILEDFDQDDRFSEMLEYYSEGQFEQRPIHLILNGDILNLIQIDVEGIFTHLETEDMAVKKVEFIHQGHQLFFNALKKFLKHKKNRATYVIGNHDFGMVWPKAQERFCQLVEHEVPFLMEYEDGKLYVEHGQRFESINSVPRDQFFIEGPNHEKVLNLPWGSLFCLYLMPRLKKERPYIDKVRPLSVYIKWSFFHDFGFFFHLLGVLVRYFLATRGKAFGRYNKNFVTQWKLLRHFSVHPKYDRNAKRIFATKKSVRVVVLGHTHIAEWRRFPEGKFYFNSGTWNTVPSMDAGLHQSISHLTYVSLEVDPESGEIQQSSLNTWRGEWRPYHEEVSVTQGLTTAIDKKNKKRLIRPFS